ncbi:MAG: SUF system NifU family Fe-S cluster assembly protein [Eubacteriales bacterium]|nr:SUF system NifU family Fe-S cluster assembly protein [Eubacteriales bacterium]
MPISLNQEEMMREIIIDNYKNPRNFKETDDPSYITIHMDSDSCIDDIYIQVKIKDGIIEDALWHGKGCAISSASTSIMTENIKGKSEKEAMKMMEEFNKMLAGQPYDEEALGDAICFANVNRQPSRITCANISWRGLAKAFKEEEEKEHESK